MQARIKELQTTSEIIPAHPKVVLVSLNEAKTVPAAVDALENIFRNDAKIVAAFMRMLPAEEMFTLRDIVTQIWGRTSNAEIIVSAMMMYMHKHKVDSKQRLLEYFKSGKHLPDNGQ